MLPSFYFPIVLVLTHFDIAKSLENMEIVLLFDDIIVTMERNFENIGRTCPYFFPLQLWALIINLQGCKDINEKNSSHLRFDILITHCGIV